MPAYIRNLVSGDFAQLADAERIVGRSDAQFRYLEDEHKAGHTFGIVLVNEMGEPHAFVVGERRGLAANIVEMYGEDLPREGQKLSTIELCLSSFEDLCRLSFRTVICTLDEDRKDTIQMLARNSYKAIRVLQNEYEDRDGFLFSKTILEVPSDVAEA